MLLSDALLIGSLGSGIACVLIFLTSLFLILLVLVQRGRGGGLSGAFGGMGGQSAFGAKAGDTFTRVTVAVATFWIVLCIFTTKFVGSTGQSRFETAAGDGPRSVTTTLEGVEETTPPDNGSPTGTPPTDTPAPAESSTDDDFDPADISGAGPPDSPTEAPATQPPTE